MFCCSRDLATKVQVLSSVEARDLWAEVRLGCKLHTGNRKQGGEGGCQVWEQFMSYFFETGFLLPKWQTSSLKLNFPQRWPGSRQQD